MPLLDLRLRALGAATLMVGVALGVALALVVAVSVLALASQFLWFFVR